MAFFNKFFKKRPFDRLKKAPRTDVTKRFELIGRVGQGSMSRVWRARDTRSGRIVALKVLDKEKTRKFEARFPPELDKPSEGEIAVTLKHPHIVQTYEWGMTQQGEQFLVMEFLSGYGLSYLVDVQNDTMKKHRLSFMIQLGEAVRYLHAQKWIHRDICPRNVMITDGDLQVKLIDFGLVVPNTAPFQAPGNRTGTANYMAPELIKRQRTDPRIDVFSFAVTCFEMYTKRYPWEAAESLEMVLQHINMPPVYIRELVPDIDPQIAETIMKGLAVDLNRRWPAIDPMLYQFREIQERLSPKPKRPPKILTPGITLAEDDESPRRKAPRRAQPGTPGITLAEEQPGITLADEQPGITLAEEPAEAQKKPPAKSQPSTPGISLADEEPPAEPAPSRGPKPPSPGITLADDVAPPTAPKAPAPPQVPTPGITLAEDDLADVSDAAAPVKQAARSKPPPPPK